MCLFCLNFVRFVHTVNVYKVWHLGYIIYSFRSLPSVNHSLFLLFPALTFLRVFLMFCILFVFFLSSLRFHSNVSFYVLFPFFVLFPIPVSPHPDTLTGQNKYYKPAKKERPGKWGVNGEAERVEEPHLPLSLPPLPPPPCLKYVNAQLSYHCRNKNIA